MSRDHLIASLHARIAEYDRLSAQVLAAPLLREVLREIEQLDDLPDDLVRQKEATEKSGVDRTTLYRQARSRKLQNYGTPKAPRYSLREVHRLNGRKRTVPASGYDVERDAQQILELGSGGLRNGT